MNKEITKICETMMWKGMCKARESKKSFEEYNKTGSETSQRKADQYFGEARGIYDTLANLKYKHESMNIFAKLID